MVRRRGIGNFGRGLIEESLAGVTSAPAGTPEPPTPAPLDRTQFPSSVRPGPASPYVGGMEDQATHAPSGYRRREVSDKDPDGYAWINPSPTAWPDVLPDGHGGRPPTPRTYTVGYNSETHSVRAVFQRPTKTNPSGKWQYDGVTAVEWERFRRRGDTKAGGKASTGRWMNSVLNGKSHGPGYHSGDQEPDDSGEE